MEIVPDVIDGYHALLLDKESQPLTVFITEWVRYMYLCLPQGYLASGDVYARWYDKLINEVPCKIKIVDDCLLYNHTIEQAFCHVWDYLQLCANNGIELNADKFKFCCETVEFAGLKITPNVIAPTDKILTVIKDFPKPQNITDVCSWFGLVNQLAWGYSLSPIMTPFRDLVKHNQTFTWNETLDKFFADSKQIIIEKIKEGIHMFDTVKPTCLQTDWSREGIGYLLLQQHCSCEPSNNALRCTNGWELVLAGSCFTSECESHYFPTEGEALAVTWALENARLFVLGCNNLIIVTDHKPLHGIFKDRKLSTIRNPRLQSLKEKTLAYKSTIYHCPGKWYQGPDAVSCNPAHLISNLQTPPTEKDLNYTYAIECHHMNKPFMNHLIY